MKKVMLALAICACASFTQAQTPVPQNQISTIGAGAHSDSCLKWLAARQYKDETTVLMYLQWAQGYLSGRRDGHSRHLGAMGDTKTPLVTLPTKQELERLLDERCKGDPKAPMIVAIRISWTGLENDSSCR